jgi:hypothetical protein
MIADTKSTYEEWRKYPAVSNRAAFARLVGAVIVSVRILRILGANHPNATFSALLVVHAADVLLGFGKWFRKHSSPEAGRIAHSLPPAWTSLAMYANAQAGLVGRCTLDSLDPGMFVDFLRISPTAESIGDAERVFRSASVPAVYTQWIMDGFSGIVDQNGTARWLCHLPELYGSLSPISTSNTRVLCAALMRFLRPDVPLDIQGIDWREAKDRRSGALAQWTTNHRQLLLIRELSALEWLRPGWKEPDPGNYPAQLAVRAVERRSALRDPAGLRPEVVLAWEREWLNELGDVGDLPDLDRFLRVRLLELLDEPVLSTSEGEQIVITMLILDYGSHYDLHRLLNSLFPFDNTGCLQAAPTLTREHVRRHFIEALLKYVTRGDTGQQDRNEPQTPREAVRERQRLQMIEALLWRLAVAPSSTGDENHSQLLYLMETLCSRLRIDDTATRTVATGTIELRERTRSISWDSDETGPKDWALRYMVCDWTKLTVRGVFHERNTAECSNLFEWSRSAVQDFDSSPPSDETYHVAAIVLDEYAEGERHTYVLNCGLKEPIRGRMARQYVPGGEPIQTGDIVVVELKRIQGAQSHYWRVLPGLQALPPKVAPRVPMRLRIQVRGRSDFEVVHPATGDLLKYDPAVWDPDLSRAHVGEALPQHVIAIQYNDCWTPVDRTALELFLDIRKRAGRFFVATFVGLVATPGSRSYRLSLGLGQNYVVPAALFTPVDLAAIEDELGRYTDPGGLLISATCSTGEDGTRILLWHGHHSDEMILRRHPGLLTPFDHRNLSWKHMDETLQAPIAHRNGGHWTVDISNVVGAPFPSEIPVTLIPLPKRGENEVEFNPTNWEFRRGSLRGEPVAYHNLREPTDGRMAFVRRWIELDRGHFVALRRAYPKVGADHVMCLTEEGVAVLAEAESLTMQSYPTAALNSPFLRYAQVSNYPEWRQLGPSFEIPLSGLPEECGDLNIADGVLASAPQYSEGGGGLCSVWWRSPTATIEAPLPPQAVSSFISRAGIKLHPGMRVVAEKEPASWRVHLESRSVKVRALWRWVELDQCGGSAPIMYLGEVHLRGRRQHVAEVLPGELLALTGPINANHLAWGMANSFAGGLTQGERVTELSKGPIWTEGNLRIRSSRLRFSGGTMGGVTLAHSPQQGEYFATKLSIREVDTQYVTLRRHFVISAGAVMASVAHAREDAHLRDELRSYLEAPVDLDVIARALRETNVVQLQRFRIPDSSGVGWTATIAVAAGEGPYLDGIDYPLEGVVRIFETDEGLRASFRKSPPVTPDDYREAVLGASMDEPVILADRLFYVGEEASSPGVHRFEWRFGRSLVAQEKELLFDGNAFSNARGFLFPGDSVTRLTFIHDGDGNFPCVMAIEQVNVEFAETTILYRQRLGAGVVHLLNVEYLEDEISIASVIGCAEASSEEISVFEQLRAAHLDYADQAALLASRLGRQPEERTLRETILGRLDGEHFLNSLGREVVFRHVRMAFRSSPSTIGATLNDGEMVFMQAGTIAAVRNDAVLDLLPYPGLRNADIGPEWDGCGVLRRRFSVRDDLLTQLLQRSGRSACQGTIYLVSVNQAHDRVHASIIDGPPRRLRALAAALDESRVPLLATIVGVRDSRLRLEVQPGLFFSLPFDRFDYPEADFERGTSVRIQPGRYGSAVRFSLVRAVMSDERYIPTNGRPAVALPKNVLLREVPFATISSRARFWEGAPDSRSKSFTIAGLPGIEAVPGSLSEDAQKWLSPNPQEFTALMQRRHPYREVLLGRDDRDFRIAPLKSALFAVGSLSIEDVPTFKPSPSTSSRVDETLPWTAISFLDGSIAEVQRHSEVSSWMVHDTHSGSWKGGLVEWERLGSHTAKTGPLFFARKDGRLTLRFDAQQFTTFGYPVQEILDSLAKAPKRTRSFPVAGTSSGGGLWLEVAPGRLSELPGQLVTREIRGREISIAHFAWKAFAPGDQVVLRLVTDRASRVDRVMLREWRPGARGLFGYGRTFLPVIGFDDAKGGLELGAGHFKLTVPARTSIAAACTILLPNNTLIPAHTFLPVAGDTVLIGIEQGSAVVLGMPGVTPIPDRQRESSWAMDPLSVEIRNQLLGLIGAVGGALAVTVEAFVSKDKVLYFSRRQQTVDGVLARGTISEAALLGSLRNSVLLRCGSEIIKAQMSDVVAGVPAGLGEEAIRVLKASNESVWIRRTSEKQSLSFGISAEGSRQFAAEAVCAIVGDVQKKEFSGIICRSLDALSLHWLPQEECAWVRLGACELDAVIRVYKNRTFAVRHLHDDRPGPITVTGVLSVRKEFDRLVPGTTFDAMLVAARSVPGAHNCARWLAVASGVGVLVECEVPEDHDAETGSVVRLEVTRRTTGRRPSLAAVPLGSKKYVLDLPLWMKDISNGKQPEYLHLHKSWRDEDIVAGVLENSAEELDRRLIYSWREAEAAYSAARANAEYSVVRSWLHENLDRPEMEAASAIMAILILYRNGHHNTQALAAETGGREHWNRRLYDCRREALRLLQHIGRRASHSAHVEILSAGWLCSQGPCRTDDLARRLDRLRVILGQTVDRGDIWLIRQFCRAAELRSSPDLAMIAMALRAAMGDEIEEERLLGDAVVTSELISLSSALPDTPGDCLADLPSSFVERLERLLTYIHHCGVPITLLDYLPVLEDGVRTEDSQSIAKGG